MTSDRLIIDHLDASQVAHGKTLSVPVLGPGDVNLMLIFTGTADLRSYAGPREGDLDTSNDLRLEIVLFDPYPFSIPKGVQQWSATYMSVASEASDPGADGDNDEWQFDVGLRDGDVITEVDGDRLVLRAHLLVGIDSFFNRVAYQATVLAHAAGK
jgi:hypothetical protein